MRRAAGTLGVWLLAAAGAAAGQEPAAGVAAVESQVAVGGPPQEWRLSLAGAQRTKLPVRIDEGGRVAVHRSVAEAGLGRWFGRGLRLGGRVEAEHSIYELRDANLGAAAGDDPWGHLSLVRLNLSCILGLSRDLSLSVFAGLRAGFERGTELDQSLTGAGFAFLDWRLDPDLSLQIGVGFLSRLEEDPLVIPAIGVRWEISDWLSLRTQGLGVRLEARPHASLQVALEARYDNRQYRFEDRRRTLAEHILEDQEVVAALALSWRPWPWLGVDALVGVVAYQEFELRDADGDRVARVRSDPAPWFQLGLSLDL